MKCTIILKKNVLQTKKSSIESIAKKGRKRRYGCKGKETKKK